MFIKYLHCLACVYVYLCVNFCIFAREIECFTLQTVEWQFELKNPFFSLLAPEKIMYEKLEEEIEMEVKGTVTIDVTLNN